MSRKKDQGKLAYPLQPVESLTPLQCDERKPSCGTCIRLGKICEKSQAEFRFRAVTTSRSRAAFSEEKPRCLSREPAGEKQKPNYLSHYHDSWIAELDAIKSLQHTERDIFYETHWEAICLPAVHPLFKSKSASAWKHPILKDALLALSACNISRLYPESKNASVNGTIAFGPNLVHQTRSQLFYSSAIKRFNSMRPSEHQHNTGVIFTVLVLFAHLESSMGNFEGFHCHMQGLATFLVESRDALGDEHIRELMIALQQVRYVVWWGRVYFSTLDIQCGLSPIPMPSLLEGCFKSMHGRRVMALDIMCESHRLNFKGVFRHWRPEIEGQGSDDVIYPLLAAEARKSDEWLLRLPESEQPMENDLESDPKAPIRFQSHDAALNFAYYVTGRIMQCTDPLNRVDAQPSPHHEPKFPTEDDWVRLLMQIARGIDIQTAVSRNSYTIGFSGLFLAAILRCRSLVLGIEIQEWLEALLRLQPTEEGAFPVYQTLGIVRVINHERFKGREIFAVSQPVDDGGGTPKFACYNSQFITSLLLHGRLISSGELFTENVSIKT